MAQESETLECNKYTDEQKIVAAVWVHEKFYNSQSWDDIFTNFKIRFKTDPPMRRTLMNWEKKLFNVGTVKNRDKSGRPLARLMHVPYVRASMKENPNLSIRERASELGLPRTTLLKIIQEDLKMKYKLDPTESNFPDFESFLRTSITEKDSDETNINSNDVRTDSNSSTSNFEDSCYLKTEVEESE